MEMKVPPSEVREGFWRGTLKLSLEDSEATSQGKRKGEAFQAKDWTQKRMKCILEMKRGLLWLKPKWPGDWSELDNSLSPQSFVGDGNYLDFNRSECEGIDKTSVKDF